MNENITILYFHYVLIKFYSFIKNGSIVGMRKYYFIHHGKMLKKLEEKEKLKKKKFYLLEFIPSVPWTMYGALEINRMNALSYLFSRWPTKRIWIQPLKRYWMLYSLKVFFLMNLTFTFKFKCFNFIDVTL